jgi:hypothetical protein
MFTSVYQATNNNISATEGAGSISKLAAFLKGDYKFSNKDSSFVKDICNS